MKPICVFILCGCTFHLMAQMPKMENGKLILDKQVSYKTASYELTDEGKEALQQVKEYLVAKEYITKLRIEGHLDNNNTEEKNQWLSEKRALEVAQWLVTNGIGCNRLIVVGFGSTKPLADNSTPEGKAQNRRIEFIPAELRGKAIGGMPLDGGGKVSGDPCLK
jgi:OmpA-OmpF porin, OOP family